MLRSSVESKFLKQLPDNRPITAIQVVQNLKNCPENFYPIARTYDQDSVADLRDTSLLRIGPSRYLCLSKTEGLPGFVLSQILLLNEKSTPPPNFSSLNFVLDEVEPKQRRAWKKKQFFYKLTSVKDTQTAITDIIVCNRLRKAPKGFQFAGELNGSLICFRMGNTLESQQQPQQKSPVQSNQDSDYEILSPYPVLPANQNSQIATPSSGGGGVSGGGALRNTHRPAPPVPPPAQNVLTHQNSLSGGGGGGGVGGWLDGVPFVINTRFLDANGDGGDKGGGGVGKILGKIKTKDELRAEYDYSFSVERESLNC